MRKQNDSANYFDEMELWADSPSSRKQKPFKELPEKDPGGLDDFFDDMGGYTVSGRSALDRKVRSDYSRKKKVLPWIWAVAAVLACIFGAAEVLPRLGKEQPSASSHPAAKVEPVLPQPTATLPAPVAPSPSPKREYRYFGSMLSPEYKKIYDNICEGIARRDDFIGPFHISNVNDINLIIQSVTYDYPEYFWFRGVHSGTYYDYDTYVDYTVSPQYEFSAQEYTAHATFVESATQPILSQLEGKSDYEKVKGVYEYLVDNTIYDRAYTGTTIYEMFHDGRGVCEGYARATQYLLTKLGVETLFVTGNGGEFGLPRSQWESHAWNIVRIDGTYYQLDTTWGDPVNDDDSQIKNFWYLNLTDAEIARAHDRNEWNKYPTCSSIRHNYYIYEGRYLDIFSKDTIENWFRDSYAKGQPLEFKCASEDIYRQAYHWLVDNEGFKELFRSVVPANTAYRYGYGYSDELYIINVDKEQENYG